MKVKKIVLTLSLAIMAVTIWGLLSKSQVDNEKIEEAIARLIAAHEVDESAHLEAGESLQSHKAAEVIDHAVQSIIEDKIKDGEITGPKLTNNQIIGKDFRTDEDVGEAVDGVKFNSDGIEMWDGGVKKVNIPKTGDPTFEGTLTVQNLVKKKFVMDTIFESLDGYGTYSQDPSGDVYLSTVGYVVIDPGTVANKESLLVWTSEVQLIRPKTDELVFEAGIFEDDKVNVSFAAGENVDFAQEYTQSIGFLWNALQQKLFCILRVNNIDYSHEIFGFDPTGHHLYRFEVKPASVDYYVDNVLVRQTTAAIPDGEVESGWIVRAKNKSTGGEMLAVTEVRYIQNRRFQ